MYWYTLDNSPLSDKQFFLKKRFYLFIFRQRGREGERERNINVWLPLMCPQLGTWPTIQVYALTGNWTSDPLVHRLALNPLSHTSQGPQEFLKHAVPDYLVRGTDLFSLRWSNKKMTALAGVAQWIECQPVKQRVTRSIPSQGTCLGWGPGPQ